MGAHTLTEATAEPAALALPAALHPLHIGRHEQLDPVARSHSEGLVKLLSVTLLVKSVKSLQVSLQSVLVT